jgi:hypothetical protein
MHVVSMFSRALKRLDRIIGEINAGLFAIALGLAVLNVAVFVALNMPSAMPVCVNCESIQDSDLMIPVTGPIIMRLE